MEEHGRCTPWSTRLAADAINYRHIIEWLVRKPWGVLGNIDFGKTSFRVPFVGRTTNSRKRFWIARPTWKISRILRQAARTMESEVERVLVELERLQVVLGCKIAVREFWPNATFGTPELMPLTVELESYDQLLQERG